MASVEEVEAVLARLLSRLGPNDPGTRALLPARRTIEAHCPDLGLVRHAELRDGQLEPREDPPSRPADIRVSVHSDDLLRIVNGDLALARAIAGGQLRIDASMADLMRLRTLL